MSNAPTSDAHPTVPVGTASEPPTLHGNPSGVPSAAACHFAFDGNRFPTFRAAATA